MTTIDQVIQHYTEKAIAQVQESTSSERVMAIVMNPKTGEILAMAQTPEFDLNDPTTPLDEEEQKKLESMSDSEKVTYWNQMWRNFLISDAYEPGSTFKLLTTAIALEEGCYRSGFNVHLYRVYRGGRTDHTLLEKRESSRDADSQAGCRQFM